MIPAVIAAVVSVVVIVIGGVTIAVARQQRSSRNDLIRTLSISAVVFGHPGDVPDLLPEP
jgi:hypothetical protein